MKSGGAGDFQGRRGEVIIQPGTSSQSPHINNLKFVKNVDPIKIFLLYSLFCLKLSSFFSGSNPAAAKIYFSCVLHLTVIIQPGISSQSPHLNNLKFVKNVDHIRIF